MSSPTEPSSRRPFPWLVATVVLLVLAGFLVQLVRGDCPVP
jgi:hypothetical protein